MTVFNLALRSMRQNIKQYYLYFFSLIFSICLLFVFASMQHDKKIQTMLDSSIQFEAAFQTATIFLIIIIFIFTISANRIFVRRRSRELGMYQLIGLTKGWVIRYLMIENLVLGFGALVFGVLIGGIITRFFELILINLLKLESITHFSFSISAAIDALLVFVLVFLITSVQIISIIKRSSLIYLFQADKQPDTVNRRPNVFSAIIAVLGIALIGYGYQLSGRMVDNQLQTNALIVLFSIIVGTYILFRISISCFFYWLRLKKNGYLNFYDSLSLAPLIYRMKANASSFTIITLLSALTITLVTMAYAMYYSTEKDVRLAMPFDFAIENNKHDADAFSNELKSEGIAFQINTLSAVRIKGDLFDRLYDKNFKHDFLFISAEQLQEAGMKISVPLEGEGIDYLASAFNAYDDIDFSKRYPTTFSFQDDGVTSTYKLNKIVVENLVNDNIYGRQILISEATLLDIRKRSEHSPEYESVEIDTFRIVEQKSLAQASEIYKKYSDKDSYVTDYYSSYTKAIQGSGLIIFIAAFLGLVFLASTGSIIYFKQMTEAEQERQTYRTLRQLGFDESTIMKGIIRKQVIVFLLPLVVGIVHAYFAIKAASSIMIVSNISFPVIMSMLAFIVIYLLFMLLSVGYYRKIVKRALL